MKDLLIRSGIEFEGDFIKIPEWCKRIKFDIGLSDNAPHSQRWLEKEDDLLIFGFEPNPFNMKKIKSSGSTHFAKLDTKYINYKIFLIECALSDVKKIEYSQMYCTELDAGCSSLLKPRRFKVNGLIEVETWSLAHFMKYIPFHKIPYIDFVKTDCQGFDMRVIEGCGEYLKNVAIFTCEADNWRYHKADNGIFKMTKFFKKNNFFRYRPSFNFLEKIKFEDIKTKDPTFINKALVDKMLTSHVRAFQFW